MQDQGAADNAESVPQSTSTTSSNMSAASTPRSNTMSFRAVPDDYEPVPNDGSADGLAQSETALVASTSSLSDTNAPLPPPPDDKPVKVRKKRPDPPTKGILKEPSVAVSRFSFKRDVLQPFASSAYGQPAQHAANGQSSSPVPFYGQNGVVGNAASIAGGLWGNALRRLGGAGAAAAPPASLASVLESAPTSQLSASTSSITSDASGDTATSAKAPSSSISNRPTARPDPLKKVTFRAPALKVVYPINEGTTVPIPPLQEKRTRRRINHEARRTWQREAGETKGWTGDELFKLYHQSCEVYEEPGIERVRQALKGPTPPKTLDLSNEMLTKEAIEALADVLAIDFGLKKLVLENCGLNDDCVKPLVHALLVSGSLPHLSLAGNKRIRSRGWAVMAAFLAKASFLKHLDLSDTSIDRRSAEMIAQALNTAKRKTNKVVSPSDHSPQRDENGEALAALHSFSEGETGKGADDGSEEEESEDEPDRFHLFYDAPLLRHDEEHVAATVMQSLRLENAGIRGSTLESLAKGIRTSALKHISLRRNRINNAGASFVALMIRDYPISADDRSLFMEGTTLPVQPMRPPLTSYESSNSVTAREGLLRPPDTRQANGDLHSQDGPAAGEERRSIEATREEWENSEARLRLQRQIQDLPRIGSLLTLDVKNNDLRNGVGYIAQVLKRNRTLRVLNLSENKIDVGGLVAIADALRYNTTLETLDMSMNPCCGPTTEGVLAMRSAITFSTSIKRVFLNATNLSSEGAIALAEFLPEAKSLLHLDLTSNFDIDIAGVLALSVAIKMNKTIRCLDLNIPPNSQDFAQLSQDILQCCIRNTELAQHASLAKGHKAPVAAPIHRSTVAQAFASHQERSQRLQAQAEAAHRSNDEILRAADECYAVLDESLRADEEIAAKGILVRASDLIKDLLVQAQLAEAQLMEAVAVTREGEQRRHAETLGDKLSAILDRAKALYEPAARQQHSQEASSPKLERLQPTASPGMDARRSRSPSPSPVQANVSTPRQDQQQQQQKLSPLTLSPQPDRAEEASSPSFSIADSDDESLMGSPVKQRTSFKMRQQARSIAISEEGDDRSNEDSDEGDDQSIPRSPVETQSRTYTLEEGEVFRKERVLGTVDDEETVDVSGEELRKEILHTPVQKTRRMSSDSSL